MFAGLGRSHPENPSCCGRGQSEESGWAWALSHLREKENGKSLGHPPQATGKRSARWNSTSNANKIIMTIFMGECRGPSVGFHYHVYECDHLCAASLPLQAAAVGWCMVIWCKLPPNMVILSSARGVGSHKPGDVGSRCFLTSVQAAGIVEKGKATHRQCLPLPPPACTLRDLEWAAWPGMSPFLIGKIGTISAVVAWRTRQDTLRAPTTEPLLIFYHFFGPQKCQLCRLSSQCPGLSPGPPRQSPLGQKMRTTWLK